MLERIYLRPDDMWSRVEHGELLYSPIVVVRGGDHAHVYLAGQIPRLPTGEVVGEGDMRAQLRQVCENIRRGLEHVGATFDDVVRATTYVTDLDEYIRCSDERYKYFRKVRPASTLIPVLKLGAPKVMVEIECEAIIEAERLRILSDASG